MTLINVERRNIQKFMKHLDRRQNVDKTKLNQNFNRLLEDFSGNHFKNEANVKT